MVFQYSCKLITIQNCSLSQTEVDRIIQRAYDNGNTGGTLEIRKYSTFGNWIKSNCNDEKR